MKFILGFKIYKNREVVKENNTHSNLEGDCVLVSLDSIGENTCLPGIIANIYDYYEFPYLIKFNNGNFELVDDSEIIRHLTPEEIEKYKIEIQIDKYNL